MRKLLRSLSCTNVVKNLQMKGVPNSNFSQTKIGQTLALVAFI